MKNRFSLAAAVAVAVFLFGCSDADPVAPTLADGALTLSKGSTQRRQVTEFTMFLGAETILNFGECFRVDNGTTHLRGCETTAVVTGDFEGIELATLHVVAPPGGHGQAGGTFTFDLCHVAGDLGCGIFEGNFEGPIRAGVGFRGHVQGRGTAGDFVGLKMQATSTNTPEAPRPFVVVGTIR